VVISGALPQPILQGLAARLEAINATRDSSYLAATPQIHASAIGSAAVVIGAALAPSMPSPRSACDESVLSIAERRFNFM
jgi:hypothetical protein